jgi:hypothetical protein
MSHTQKVTVRIEGQASPLIKRAVAILRDRIQERCAAQVVEGQAGALITLAVDSALPAEAFRIEQTGAGVRVCGGSARGLLYGVGKFLRTSRYEDGFKPSAWRGTSTPRGALRGMYFAMHFHNWYHLATEAEIVRYTEDMALWGVNAVMAIFPFLNLEDWNDPEAEPAMARLRQYARAARDLDLQFATGVSNALFRGAPQPLRAARLPDPLGRRGNSGHPVCPSSPEGHVCILENVRVLFERLAGVGLDILCHWPYDEGGCSCETCAPWGSNGYFKLSRDLTLLGRQYFPSLKTVLSTWMFDTPPEGEWEGLTENLKKENGWVDYILADAHEDFPRYPLDRDVPGNLPLLNFPEISMWGNWPWGGLGAHPLPARFQRLWDQVKHKVAGGFPYSEGIYEDMSKAVVVQFYWDRDRTARQTLEEYIAFEFGSGVTAEALNLVELLESSATRSSLKQTVDKEAVERACRLAKAIDGRLPDWAREGWRWQILLQRAILDQERFVTGSLETPAAETAMLRLIEIFHSQMETDDPYHHRVRPPLKRAVSRKGTA